MLLGILSALIVLWLMLKWASRVRKWNKLDRLLRKTHVIAGIVALIVSLLHMAFTFKVWRSRSILMIILGIVACLILFGMAMLYFFRKKIGCRWLNYHRIGALAIMGLVMVHMVVCNIGLFEYKEKISGIHIEGIDVSQIPDGVYHGECDAGYIYAEVAVYVKDQAIEKIDLITHRNERGAAAELLTEKMVAAQNTQIDTITGATNSSLVIEKAVENALQ